MTTEELNALHKNPANWRLAFFYFAPGDPRIVVKKRVGAMGWTMNFARPLSFPFTLALIAGAYGYIQILNRLELSSPGTLIGILIFLAAIIVLCNWLSDPRRYTN